MNETYTPAAETATTPAEPTTATPADVRAWARETGRTDVGARGRLSSTVKSAFTAATGRKVA